MKKQEKRYVSRINELEEKAEKHQKTESIVKSLKHDIPKIEDNVYLKLSEMENSFRHQQQLSEEAAKVSSAPKFPFRGSLTRCNINWYFSVVKKI